MKLAQVRSRLISRRRQLDPDQISTASRAISARLWQQPVMQRARRIGCYLAVNGEVDCEPGMNEAWDRGRQIFLPVLHRGVLRFARYEPGSVLRLNRFGIPEPNVPARELISPMRLDVVLAPLVAFDMQGTRLGMGGGYYDRSLAPLAQREHWRSPRVIGLAYAFQCVPALPRRHWDIPLHAAVTDEAVCSFTAMPEKTLPNGVATPSGRGKN